MKNKVFVIVFLVAFVILFKPHVDFNITTNEQTSEVALDDEDCECATDNNTLDKPVSKSNEAH